MADAAAAPAAEQRPAEPAWPDVLRTKGLRDKIKSAKVLCVGAGGIGCELLKTLVCSGFRNITVIDLDTIETSNLNRQFLFRKHHVGQSKADTAAAVIRGLCPSASITSHHANVKDAAFDVDFFRSFDLVLNGLDNLEARRHVNRLCLASERPLIESGTAGYLGQVTVHVRGATECFECTPKPVPRSFPICTLRNTPDKPIHTVVWAKDLLFGRLFGPPEAVSDLDDQARREADQAATAAAEAQAGGGAAAAGGVDADAAAATAASAAAAAAAAPEEASFFVRREGEGSLEYAARVFGRVYGDDVERLAAVKELWEKRPAPVPLRLAELLPPGSEAEAALRAAVAAAAEARRAGGEAGAGAAAVTSASRALGLKDASQKWTPAQSAAVLLLATVLYHEARPDEVGRSTFDKDDDLAVDFVTAASNLRSACYGIPQQSLFDAKGMAGNIIHAIASTNAIVSGLIVTEALKLLAGCSSALRSTFLCEFASMKRLVVVSTTAPPRPACMVCGRAQLTLRLNTQATTLGSLLSGVIRKRLAINVPNLLCGGFMYEEGEGLEEDEVAAYAALLPRPLADLPGGGLRHGSLLTVTDQSQHFAVELILAHSDKLTEEEAPDGFVLEGALPTPRPQAEAEAEAEAAPKQEAAPAPAAPKRAPAAREDAEGALLISDSDEEGPAAAAQGPAAAGPAAAAAAAGKQAPSRKRGAEAVAEEGEGADGGDAKRARGPAAAAAAAAAAGPSGDADDAICITDDD